MPVSPKMMERMTEEFKEYRRTNIASMRPYIKGESLADISVSKEDNPANDMGMIARNPDNYKDQWYVARAYFEKNFEPYVPHPKTHLK